MPFDGTPARRDAAALLMALEALLGDGRCWAQGEFAGEHGRYCLRGGLDYLRGDCAGGDGLAEMLLLAAVKERCGYEVPVVQFNDGADSFEEVRQVIARARYLAETCAAV